MIQVRSYAQAVGPNVDMNCILGGQVVGMRPALEF